jgi:hypothetical protein
MRVKMVSNTYCVGLFVFLRLVYHMFPVSLDGSFLIAPSVFYNVYLLSTELTKTCYNNIYIFIIDIYFIFISHKFLLLWSCKKTSMLVFSTAKWSHCIERRFSLCMWQKLKIICIKLKHLFWLDKYLTTYR